MSSDNTTTVIPTKKKLFCVIAQKWLRDDRGRIVWEAIPLVYLHAFDSANAKFEYRKTDIEMKTRIVMCGEVVGYFCDDNGENLST